MGKILIIKDADFSSVAIDRVTPSSYSPVINIFAKGIVKLVDSNASSIYYTTDGSDPTTNSTIYSSAFTVQGGTTVKAISRYANGSTSSVASKKYDAPTYMASLTYITGGVTSNPNTGLVPPTAAYLGINSNIARGLFVIPRNVGDHQGYPSSSWSMVPDATQQKNNDYSFIQIPSGTKTVKVAITNSNYILQANVVSDTMVYIGGNWNSNSYEYDISSHLGETLWLEVMIKNTSNTNLPSSLSPSDIGLSISFS